MFHGLKCKSTARGPPALGQFWRPVGRILASIPRAGVAFWHNYMAGQIKDYYYMAELILLKSNWAAQNHDVLPCPSCSLWGGSRSLALEGQFS